MGKLWVEVWKRVDELENCDVREDFVLVEHITRWHMQW